MGVQGLLVLLKSIQRPCNIKKFAGMTLGVDAYGWLHPGTIPCATALAQGKHSTMYVDYVMHRVRMLIHYGVTPYIVFDGNYLPSKAATELKRTESRAEAKRKGLDLLQMGKKTEAHLQLRKAVDVTPEMARYFIEELKRLNVRYVVAPYEADAQLAYLERQGEIDGIISEDSDMLVFGAKRLITKMDKYGECIEIDRRDFTSCREVNFAGWTDDMFRRMAILTGCDYLPGLSQLGLKTAHSLVRRYKDLDRILKVISFEGKIKLPSGYLEDHRKANFTFMHQWVFDPIQQKLVMGTEWDEQDRPGDISFIGDYVEPSIAIGIAKGDLHPMTKLPLEIRTTPKKPASYRGRMLSPKKQPALYTPKDLKGQKKPIDSFFKPRRTPLAELDPNIMTPSPSQQELLRRHSGTILSTPVDENNTPAQRVAAPFSGRSTGVLRADRGTVQPNSRARTVPHPPKRQRLCDDSPGKAKDIKIGESGASKFFSTRIAEPSPSLKRQTKSRRKEPEFEIMSDGLLEEAMLMLPDLDEPHKPTKSKMAIFNDTKRTATTVSEPRDSQQDSQENDFRSSTLSTATSILSTATDDTSISLVPTTPPRQASVIQPSRKWRELAEGGGVSRSSDVAGIPEAARQPISRSSSALQRLGHAALKRAQVSSSSTELPEVTSFTPSIRAARISALCGIIEGSSSAQGSEDSFVPDSDDDTEELHVELETASAKGALNLGAFAYAG